MCETCRAIVHTNFNAEEFWNQILILRDLIENDQSQAVHRLIILLFVFEFGGFLCKSITTNFTNIIFS